MYVIVGFDRESNSHCLLETDVESLSDAIELTGEYNDDGIKAKYLTYDEYEKQTGNPARFF